MVGHIRRVQPAVIIHAKGIVESHQGRFFFDHDAPHTTFVMKLPMEQEHSRFDRPHN
jgi:nitrogen-specific signal transduction histidine kinase